MASNRPPNLTEQLRHDFALQPEPRRVFALQYLERAYQRGLVPWQVFEDLADMVRQITSICRRLFHGNWTMVDLVYDAITKAANQIVLACDKYTKHADRQIERAEEIREGLPVTSIQSAAGLNEVLRQWEGSLSVLFRPNKDTIMIFAHLNAYYLDAVWLPFLQHNRETPVHPMVELIELFDCVNDHVERLASTFRKAYKIVNRMRKSFVEACDKLDTLLEQDAIADLRESRISGAVYQVQSAQTQIDGTNTSTARQQQQQQQQQSTASINQDGKQQQQQQQWWWLNHNVEACETKAACTMEHTPHGLPASMDQFMADMADQSTVVAGGEGQAGSQVPNHSYSTGYPQQPCDRVAAQMSRLQAAGTRSCPTTPRVEQGAATTSTTPGRTRRGSLPAKPRPLNILKML